MKTKVCSNLECLQPEKSLSEFHKHSGRKDGLQNYCKVCKSEMDKTSHKKHRKQHLLQRKKFRQENPEKIKAQKQKYREENQEKENKRIQKWINNNRERHDQNKKDWFMKTKYGITLNEYLQMLESQNHLCAICNNPETRKDRTGKVHELVIDHDHITNKVRGLLCSKCNSGIGMLKDNISILDKAILYLKQYKEK